MEVVPRSAPTGAVAPAPREQITMHERQEAPQTQEAKQSTEGQNDPQKLEVLAKKEQRIRREAQRIAAERQQIAQMQAQLQGMHQENAQLRNWAQRFYRDPVNVLNEAGVPGDVITQGLLNQPSREAVTIRQLQNQIAQLSQQNQQIEQRMTSSQQQQYEQAKNQIRNDTQVLVDGDAASYEAIKARGTEAVEAVAELIERTYFKNGRLMSVKEAADEVENYLIEEASKMASLNKIRNKLSQPVGGQPTGGVPNTLSNRSIPAPMSRGKISEKERIARAIAAFKGASRT